MENPVEWSLVTADAREATRARHTVREFLARQASSDSDLEAVEIIVGELVANVIRYAPGAMGIHVAWENDGAVLIVADRGPGLPPVRSLPDHDASTGRGLSLIQSLAREVEIDTVPGNGTRIKVHLPVRRASVSSG
jgi:anti-sigma regulatory factor (Ser/Thr protein kinase)